MVEVGNAAAAAFPSVAAARSEELRRKDVTKRFMRGRGKKKVNDGMRGENCCGKNKARGLTNGNFVLFR